MTMSKPLWLSRLRPVVDRDPTLPTVTTRKLRGGFLIDQHVPDDFEATSMSLDGPDQVHFDMTDQLEAAADRIGTAIARLEDENIKAALVAAGWTPPDMDAEQQLRARLADQVHAMRFDGGIGSVPDLYFWGITHAERLVRGETQ